MSDSEKFELLKKKVDALKVKKLASESQAKRLQEQLQNCKTEIKQTYGVQITDFAKAIETMKEEHKLKLSELETLVSQAEQKMED